MEGSTPNQLLQICSVSAKLKFDLCCEHHLINSLNSTSDSQSPHAKNVIQISFTFFPNNFRAFLITESCLTAICHPANFLDICLQSLIFSMSGNFPGELSKRWFSRGYSLEADLWRSFLRGYYPVRLIFGGHFSREDYLGRFPGCCFRGGSFPETEVNIR